MKAFSTENSEQKGRHQGALVDIFKCVDLHATARASLDANVYACIFG